MTDAIKVEGLRELRKDIKRLQDRDMAEALREANRYGAIIVADAARPNVPVRTGKLRGTIKPLAGQTVGRVKAGSARVPYAGAIHWGRKRGNVGRPPGNRRGSNVVEGRPFLWEALDRKRQQIIDEYQRQIDVILERVGNG